MLQSAFGGFVAHLAASYDLANPSAMNPGSLGDWPISQQRPLFDLLGDVEADRRAPQGELPDGADQVRLRRALPHGRDLRQLPDVPARALPEPPRMPYDPEMFERKYQAPVVAAETEIPLC